MANSVESDRINSSNSITLSLRCEQGDIKQAAGQGRWQILEPSAYKC